MVNHSRISQRLLDMADIVSYYTLTLPRFPRSLFFLSQYFITAMHVARAYLMAFVLRFIHLLH